MRIRFGTGFWNSRPGLAILGIVLLGSLAAAAAFTHYYLKYSRMIDQRLAGHGLTNATQLYSAPARIVTGAKMERDDLVAYLQRVGYRPAAVPGSAGQYFVQGNTVEIRPGAASFFEGGNALKIQFGTHTVKSVKAQSGADMPVAEIEPELLTNLFDEAREKRRPVRYEDLPKVLVNAVLSAEDKRFFEHGGFDPIRILGAAWADLHRNSRLQGASTLTMQVARSFFFTTERTWQRKLAETMVAMQIEHRFSKPQIFELYANEIYLGNRGSFSIHGFAEASVAYFGKDVHQLSLGEAAFLAGIIRAPNHYSSADHRPERGIEARDRVLTQMVENKYATREAAHEAMRTPLRILSGAVEASAAPYFVDMVKDHLLEKFTESELLTDNFRVYTTLDLALQRAAAQAVEAGLKNVDTLLAKRYQKWQRARLKKKAQDTPPPPKVQVALVALDPKTGEIKALIGGRDYSHSQLNHAIARRQPGSAFKPFVYAAAFDNAVDGVSPIVTPSTTILDEPTTFVFDGKEYTPNNFGAKFMGYVTARDALTNSLNVATIKVAELVGYGRIVQVARQLGLDPHIQATPAVALGAYEMTAIEVAAGYTVFANAGTRAEPMYLRSVVNNEGAIVERFDIKTRRALDPRVAFLVTSILQDVINRGTGAGVRARGFAAPAGGKTGTSRDGWFAGFTSNLVCIVWVGFDDNRDLGLAGSAAAGPFWAEFMKRAVAVPGYQDTKDFPAPEGIVSAAIDPETLQLATPSCPVTRKEFYIAGTEPSQMCEKHGGSLLTKVPGGSWLSRIFGGGSKSQENPKADSDLEKIDGPHQSGVEPPAPEEKKKGVLKKIFGIFGGNKNDREKPKRDKGEPP